jgi:sucrose-6-phosphate hydrolase SacC (GH32 family)
MNMTKELSLHKIENQYQLRANTFREINKICTNLVDKIPARLAKENQVLVEGLGSGIYRLLIEFDKDSQAVFGLKFYNDADEMIVLGFDGQTNNYFMDRSKSGKTDFHEDFSEMIFAPLPYEQDVIKWEVLVDKGGIEVIADDGQINLSSIYFASKALTKIGLIVAGKEVEILDGKVTVLQSIWD